MTLLDKRSEGSCYILNNLKIWAQDGP